MTKEASVRSWNDFCSVMYHDFCFNWKRVSGNSPNVVIGVQRISVMKCGEIVMKEVG